MNDNPATESLPEIPGMALNVDFLASALAAEIGVTLSLPFGDEGHAATATMLKAAITAALIAKLTAAPPRLSIDERLGLELDAFASVRTSIMEQAVAHLALRNSIIPPAPSEVN